MSTNLVGIESTVWVNEAHPEALRAVRAGADGYHIALTVAMAVAPLATKPARAHATITTFLERWDREDKNGSRGRGRPGMLDKRIGSDELTQAGDRVS